MADLTIPSELVAQATSLLAPMTQTPAASSSSTTLGAPNVLPNWATAYRPLIDGGTQADRVAAAETYGQRGEHMFLPSAYFSLFNGLGAGTGVQSRPDYDLISGSGTQLNSAAKPGQSANLNGNVYEADQNGYWQNKGPIPTTPTGSSVLDPNGNDFFGTGGSYADWAAGVKAQYPDIIPASVDDYLASHGSLLGRTDPTSELGKAEIAATENRYANINLQPAYTQFQQAIAAGVQRGSIDPESAMKLTGDALQMMEAAPMTEAEYRAAMQGLLNDWTAQKQRLI